MKRDCIIGMDDSLMEDMLFESETFRLSNTDSAWIDEVEHCSPDALGFTGPPRPVVLSKGLIETCTLPRSAVQETQGKNNGGSRDAAFHSPLDLAPGERDRSVLLTGG
jgi:hypothetical protein